MRAAGLRSPSAVRAAHDIRVVVGRLRRRLREAYDHRELTPSQASLLSRLDKCGEATASELAAAERIRPQSVASILNALDDRRLIQRRADPFDGRRLLVSLSSRGRATLADTQRAGEEWLARELDERFTEAERRTVIEAMTLLDRLNQP